MGELGDRAGDQVDSEPTAYEAYARCLPEMMALDKKSVQRVNLDVSAVVAKAFGVLPKIRSLRPEFERIYREFDWRLVDRLEEYARALLHAHTKFRTTCMPRNDPAGLVDEGKALRAVLLSCIEACAKRGFVHPSRFRRLKKTNGFLSLATDLGILVAVFSSETALMERQRLVEPADLVRAEELSRQLLEIAGRRRRRRQNVQKASDVRARAFTLLMRNYERVRLAVQYMRFDQGDADKIAPTLFGKRVSRKQRERRALRAAARNASANALNPTVVAALIPAPLGEKGGGSAFQGSHEAELTSLHSERHRIDR